MAGSVAALTWNSSPSSRRLPTASPTLGPIPRASGRRSATTWTRPAKSARAPLCAQRNERAAFAIDLARKEVRRLLKAWRALFGPKFPIS